MNDHDGGQRRVLLVEDNQLVQRAVAALLRREDYHVDAAVDVTETPYDVGIFDIDIGGTDGVAVAADLLSRRVVRRVLFFTGSVLEDTIARAQAVGPVVAKGNVEDLRRAVADLTGHAQHHSEG